MALPEPVQGLLIRYSYLWRAEQERGEEEGVKDRPCAVILVVVQAGGEKVVTVLPIMHTPPGNPNLAIELPTATKARLKLDGERSWVILAEANRFVWPGPDLRPIKRDGTRTIVYGLLPYRLTEEIRRKFLEVLKERPAGMVTRTE